MNDLSIFEINDKAQAWAEKYWNHGNKVLYNLCKGTYSKHDKLDVIISKMWLIGRSYAAQIERHLPHNHRKNKKTFYECILAPTIARNANLFDKWFEKLAPLTIEAQPAEIISIHKEFVDFFMSSGITKNENRSFASKYLHFHFPDKFYIYDSRVAQVISSRKLKKVIEFKQDRINLIENRDKFYSDVFLKCRAFQRRVNEEANKITPTKRELHNPREVDNFLLYFDAHFLKQ